MNFYTNKVKFGICKESLITKSVEEFFSKLQNQDGAPRRQQPLFFSFGSNFSTDFNSIG
jgi:hypothetical protein